MNKRVLGTIAVAGLSTACSAQGVTLYFDADSTDVSLGDIVTWTVSASFTGYTDPTAYFGGFVGSFISAAPSAGEILSTTNLMPVAGTVPSPSGASIGNVNIFQAAVLGATDPANPLAIFSFEMRVLAEVEINTVPSYSVSGGAFVFPDSGIFTIADEYTDIRVVSSGIPVPGSAVVLGIGGLWAGRRRRG